MRLRFVLSCIYQPLIMLTPHLRHSGIGVFLGFWCKYFAIFPCVVSSWVLYIIKARSCPSIIRISCINHLVLVASDACHRSGYSSTFSFQHGSLSSWWRAVVSRLGSSAHFLHHFICKLMGIHPLIAYNDFTWHWEYAPIIVSNALLWFRKSLMRFSYSRLSGHVARA